MINPTGDFRPDEVRFAVFANATIVAGSTMLVSVVDWGQYSSATWGANVGNMWRTAGQVGAALYIMHICTRTRTAVYASSRTYMRLRVRIRDIAYVARCSVPTYAYVLL